VAVTFTASWHKVLDPNPRIGFPRSCQRQLAAAGANPRLIFNDRLDAAVTGVLVVMVGDDSDRIRFRMLRIISGSKSAATKEAAVREDNVGNGGASMKVESLPGLWLAGQPRAAVLRELFRLVSALTHMAGVGLAILREIFDESAYPALSGSQPSGILTQRLRDLPARERASQIAQTKMLLSAGAGSFPSAPLRVRMTKI